MPQHQLALPLPAAYQHGLRDGYSFFTTTATASGEGPQQSGCETLDRYLDDLCAFLTKTRLIQKHPEDFFSYVRSDAWLDGAAHADAQPVTREERDYTLDLCHAFRPLLKHEGDDGAGEMRGLRNYVRDGPPAVEPGREEESVPRGLQHLQDFYAATRRLMLGRRCSPNNDGASVTLTLRPGDAASTVAATSSHTTTTAPADAARVARVLKFTMSFGMNPKKQHEVAIMRGVIADLVSCCRASSEDKSSETGPSTVINIGEGKGYVSRTIALCDGLQVVGVDCNPAHKERAFERFEDLLEHSVSLRSTVRGRDIVNLLYEPRGHVASITCRLGDQVDWAALLRGHVRVRDDATGEVHETDADNLETVTNVEPATTDGATTQSPHSSPTSPGAEPLAKLQCKACGKLIPVTSASVLMRHAHAHVASGKDLPAGLPVKAEVDQWNLVMSQQRYGEKLLAAFYDHLSYGAGAVAAARRPRPCESACGDITVSTAHRVHLRRGTRVIVAIHRREPLPQLPCEAHVADRSSTSTPETDLYVMPLTAVGFDSGTGRHLVVLDTARRREKFILFDPPANMRSAIMALYDQTGAEGPVALEPGHAAVEELRGADWWRDDNCALVLQVLPFSQPRTPIVTVPSLHNTVMIGLHPCGDLGSNVCRHFLKTESQGLLLVSCCWQALTTSGFPLSAAIRSRGMAANKVSLLLATQPLDMWSTASTAGHKSSAKILFFRSLLKVLWAEYAEAFATTAHAPSCGQCPFAPLPLLEPSFLRKVVKEKEHLQFPRFAAMVLAEYITDETAKSTAYTWHNQVCPLCRNVQSDFFNGPDGTRVVQRISERYGHDYLASFLGLTVLRMWMCHLVESLLLLDRTLYLHESMTAQGASSAVSLVPLFDGAISPRMYGVLARRW